MFENGRVLLPATGFYEWSGPKGARQPHRFEPEETFALGGISRRVGDDTEVVIVTTTPNELVEPVHNRMPVMLDQSEFDGWLNGDADEAAELMRPWSKSLHNTPLEVGSV
jgi:putative SOS response-associated peptidase YedK